MERLNSPILAGLMLIGFIWLASVAQHREVSYTHSAFDVLPKTEKQKQAAVIADLWHITQDDLQSKVSIFGE